VSRGRKAPRILLAALVVVARIRNCSFPNVHGWISYNIPSRAISALQAVPLEGSTELECDIAILGGGFGGVYTALAMKEQYDRRGNNLRGWQCNSNGPLRIVLVEPKETFCFLPLLYDLTVGTATELEVCPSYTSLFQSSSSSLCTIQHVQAQFLALESSENGVDTVRVMPTTGTGPSKIRFGVAGIIAVGASPATILSQTPGAAQYAQPFYTADHAKQTRRLLNRLEELGEAGPKAPRFRVAVIGGGYGGVELAACVARRLRTTADVTLLSRSPPLANTAAEALVMSALQSLGVATEIAQVTSLEEYQSDQAHENAATWLRRVVVRRRRVDGDNPSDDVPFDAVLWTAGSSPSFPISTLLTSDDSHNVDPCQGLLRTMGSGRLAVDSTLRCQWSTTTEHSLPQPRLWSLGDCAEVVAEKGTFSLPKTAQVAMQQADVVAHNVLLELPTRESNAKAKSSPKIFVYQNLGTLMNLGGPNGALIAPSRGNRADGDVQFSTGDLVSSLMPTVLNSLGQALDVADQILLNQTSVSAALERQLGLVNPASLGLSFGSHGLGVPSGDSPGTLSGTLAGAARRVVYAARMPTNQQRALSLVSATVSTAAALAKEIAKLQAAEEI
jgi:demethylphylloquinone reductase